MKSVTESTCASAARMHPSHTLVLFDQSQHTLNRPLGVGNLGGLGYASGRFRVWLWGWPSPDLANRPGALGLAIPRPCKPPWAAPSRKSSLIVNLCDCNHD